MKIEKEMGYSHADFFRLLPRTMGANPYKINGLEVSCVLPTGTSENHIGRGA